MRCRYNYPFPCSCRRYGAGNFLFDLFMTFITSGLWLIWIFVREMRHC